MKEFLDDGYIIFLRMTLKDGEWYEGEYLAIDINFEDISQEELTLNIKEQLIKNG